MAKSKNCNSEDYEITYIEEYDYNGDYISILAKARCCECNKKFWVREYFDFDNSENVQELTMKELYYRIELPNRTLLPYKFERFEQAENFMIRNDIYGYIVIA